eukprot:scpid17118/ scgid35288/ 
MKPISLTILLLLSIGRAECETFGANCEHSLSEVSHKIASISNASEYVTHVSTEWQFSQAVNNTWSPQAVASTGKSQQSLIRVWASELNFANGTGVLECSHGGFVYIRGEADSMVVLRGLDIRISSSECTLVVENVRLEDCGDGGVGNCLSITQCPIVEFISSTLSITGYDLTPTTRTALLLFNSSITCRDCTAFPMFGANFITANSSTINCIPARSCSVDVRVPVRFADTAGLSVSGFKFERCALQEQAVDAITPNTSCFTGQLSSYPRDTGGVTFIDCEFVVSSQTHYPWLDSQNSGQVSVRNSIFKFDGSVLAGSGPSQLAWPLLGVAILSDVQFLCISLPSQPCLLRDPQVEIHSSRNVYFASLAVQDCHSSHCMFISKSTNVTMENVSFSNASFPFLRFLDSQWSVHNSSFSNMNSSTFAPSNVHRVWFPDYYRHDCYSGAITSTFTSNQGVVCTLSDVTFFNLTSRNDSTTKSWGLGGAVFTLFTGHSARNVLHLNRVLMMDTSAGGMGGCLYIVFDGDTADNLVLLDNSTFLRCWSNVRAGAMHTVHNGNSANNSLLLRDVAFDGCHSVVAAGAFNVFLRQNITTVYPPLQRPIDGHIHLLRCQFLNNRVVLDSTCIQIWAFLPFGESAPPVVIEDCVFKNNHARHGQGAVVTYEQAIILRGNTVFINNSNTAVFLTHTSMIVDGNIIFENNTGRDYGGAIGLVENCFFYIVPQTSISFGGNTACKGPAAYVNPGVQQSIGVIGNRHSVCSLQLADTLTITPQQVDNATSLAKISFDGSHPNTCPPNGKEICDQEVCNEDVYITTLSDCVQTYHAMTFGEIPFNDLPKIDQLFVRLLSFNKNNTLRLTTDASALRLNRSRPLVGYPGKNIKLRGLEVKDQANARTVASVYITVLNKTLRQYITITPELVLVQKAGAESPTIRIEIDKTYYNSNLLQAQDYITVMLRFTLVHSSFTVYNSSTLQLRRCPPGFDISSESNICRYVGSDGVKSSLVVAHDLQTGHIYLKEGYWGHYDNSSNRIYAWRCPLFYCSCNSDPNSAYPGCIFKPLNPDLQCNQYRQGYLCGACKSNYTTRLFGTACRFCSNTHQIVGWIVLATFIIGAMAVACLVLYYNVGIPQEFLGILFFLQTCYYASEPGSAITTNWVNARPDDDSFADVLFNPCIGNSWQPLNSVVMNYSLVMIGASVIALVYLLTRFGLIQILATRSSLNGVWLIFLLTYTSITDTMFKVLSCVTADPAGKRRYYYNGNLFCYNFEGPNDSRWVAWAVFSGLLFLGVILPTPFLMFLMSRGYFKRMKQFRDIIESSYVEERRWWAGVDLLRRLVLAVIYFNAATAHQRQVSLVIISFILLAVHCLGLPYRKKWVNYSETLVLFDFFILCVLGLDGNLDRVANANVNEVPGFLFLALPLLYGLVLMIRRLYLRLTRRQDADNSDSPSSSTASYPILSSHTSQHKLMHAGSRDHD